jgi:hypothetical protein
MLLSHTIVKFLLKFISYVLKKSLNEHAEKKTNIKLCLKEEWLLQITVIRIQDFKFQKKSRN